MYQFRLDNVLGMIHTKEFDSAVWEDTCDYFLTSFQGLSTGPIFEYTNFLFGNTLLPNEQFSLIPRCSLLLGDFEDVKALNQDQEV